MDEELDDCLIGPCGCERVHGAEVRPHQGGPEADGEVLTGHEIHLVVVADSVGDTTFTVRDLRDSGPLLRLCALPHLMCVPGSLSPGLSFLPAHHSMGMGKPKHSSLCPVLCSSVPTWQVPGSGSEALAHERPPTSFGLNRLPPGLLPRPPKRVTVLWLCR